MSEFIFVHLIDKKPVGSGLGPSIPLHMTALRWFECDRPEQEIIDSAELALQSIGKIIARATEEDMFGSDKDVPVVRLDTTPGLLNLHDTLLQAMQGIEARMNERWTGKDEWNPHVSHKPAARLHPGDEVVIDDIDLIVRSAKTGNRMILHRSNLNS